MIHLSNISKTKKELVDHATKVSGAPVEWRDEPDGYMGNPIYRDQYGSIWSPPDADLAEFWMKYRQSENR